MQFDYIGLISDTARPGEIFVAQTKAWVTLAGATYGEYEIANSFK